MAEGRVSGTPHCRAVWRRWDGKVDLGQGFASRGPGRRACTRGWAAFPGPLTSRVPTEAQGNLTSSRCTQGGSHI